VRIFRGRCQPSAASRTPSWQPVDTPFDHEAIVAAAGALLASQP
jgi:hypothetical protein